METFSSSPCAESPPSKPCPYRLILQRDASAQTDQSCFPHSPEDMDSFWLRSFRHYMKSQVRKIKKELLERDQRFWKEYLSPTGAHRWTGLMGQKYKSFLLQQQTFIDYFQAWLQDAGRHLLQRKFPAALNPLQTALIAHAESHFLPR